MIPAALLVTLFSADAFTGMLKLCRSLSLVILVIAAAGFVAGIIVLATGAITSEERSHA